MFLNVYLDSLSTDDYGEPRLPETVQIQDLLNAEYLTPSQIQFANSLAMQLRPYLNPGEISEELKALRQEQGKSRNPRCIFVQSLRLPSADEILSQVGFRDFNLAFRALREYNPFMQMIGRKV